MKSILTLFLLFFINITFGQSESTNAQFPIIGPKCENFQATPISKLTDIDGIGFEYASDTSKAYLNKSLFTGYIKVCSNNGNLFSVEQYENGELVLEASYYYVNYGLPNLREIKRYSNGQLNGKEQCYHINGQLSLEFNYTNGKKNGDYILYDKFGAIIMKAVYKDDVKIECKGKYCDQ
jgi:antitoxin component YwqK of YwqJK toxin-antitoxin module